MLFLEVRLRGLWRLDGVEDSVLQEGQVGRSCGRGASIDRLVLQSFLYLVIEQLAHHGDHARPGLVVLHWCHLLLPLPLGHRRQRRRKLVRDICLVEVVDFDPSWVFGNDNGVCGSDCFGTECDEYDSIWGVLYLAVSGKAGGSYPCQCCC